MRDTAEHRNGRRARAWWVPVVAIATTGALVGCDSLLDVENPNNLTQEQFESPDAAASIANGALSTVARGVGEYVVAAATASDELKWVGSRDAWFDLDQGNPDNPSNEFTDDAWNWLSEGRWMADEAVKVLSGHQAEGVLPDPGDLGRAYLWAGIVYTYIGEWLEDYAFSDGTESAPLVGENNMDTAVFDQAIDYLTQAISILDGAGDSDQANWAMAQRARAKHAKAIWTLLNPPGSVPSDPLIAAGDCGGCVDDAVAAITRVGGSLTQPLDQRWFFSYSSATVDNDLGWQVNERLEHRFGSRYVIPTSDDKKRASTRISDPIDGVAAPGADFLMDRHEAGGPDGARYAPLEITNTREMLLIIAEARLAAGDGAGFRQAINALRALDGLSPYTDQEINFYQVDSDGNDIPGTSTGDSDLNLLIHHRFEQLMLQGKLFNDHYRFGIRSDLWLDQSLSVNQPGVIFPVSIGEQQSNECIIDPSGC